MNDIEKIKRHLGKPIPITLKNSDGVEDVFYFKPLNVGQQAILVEIGNKMSEKKTVNVNGKNVLKVNKAETKEMFELMLDICKTSFKELDEETLIDFTNNNFSQIADNLGNLMGNTGDKSETNLIKQAREERNNAKK